MKDTDRIQRFNPDNINPSTIVVVIALNSIVRPVN